MLLLAPEIVRDAEPACCLHGDICTDGFLCAMLEAMMQPIEEPCLTV